MLLPPHRRNMQNRRHSPFDENFRFFASSHIHLGFELCVALILFALYTKSKQYGGLTWSLWLTSVSFLLGPFWFNPVTFEWGKCYEDYVIWDRWMSETGVSELPGIRWILFLRFITWERVDCIPLCLSVCHPSSLQQPSLHFDCVMCAKVAARISQWLLSLLYARPSKRQIIILTPLINPTIN